MPVPNTKSLQPLLIALAADGAVHSLVEAEATLAEQLKLSAAAKKELLPNGKKTRFADRISRARTNLVKAGLLENAGRGQFKITAQGLAAIQQSTPVVNNEEKEPVVMSENGKQDLFDEEMAAETEPDVIEVEMEGEFEIPGETLRGEDESVVDAFVRHQRKAAEEAEMALQALVPDGFKVHGKEARQSFYRGLRVLLDGLDEMVENLKPVEGEDEPPARPSTTGPSKVKVEVE